MAAVFAFLRNAAKEKEEKLMCSILCYAGKDVTKETMEGYLLKTKMRGPDAQQVVETEFGYLGFARLAIMGLTPDGMQPFYRDGSWVICNGEIYGFRKIKKELEERGISSRAVPTVRFCFRYMKNRTGNVFPIWMRNMPAYCMITKAAS